MDSRAIECAIMELANKDPTAEPVSLPLGFLRSITDDFCKERELGKGSYGVVYKGILPGGSAIAIKKYNERILVADDRSFENEASSLMHIKHHNVVQLLGFCAESRGAMMVKQSNGKFFVAEEQTRMLCFEYMCNGGLDKHLSDESSGLEWNKRYKIIKGICNGLNFLHECNIIHLDLKPANILMDSMMMPKIADFGLSRLIGEQKSQTVTTSPLGSPGYMAPEYMHRGVISKKADIFSLGVIIIEILKGCKNDYPYYHQSTEVFQHFKEKVLSNWRNRFERSSKYTSPELHTQLVKQCIDIALECVHPEKEKRPNMSNIIDILDAAEGSCYDQNGEELPIDHQAASSPTGGRGASSSPTATGSSSPTGNGSFSIPTGGAPPFSTGRRGASSIATAASIPTAAAPHPHNDSRDIQEHAGGVVSTWIHDDGGRGTSSSPTGNGSFSITTGGAPPFSTGERGASIATATTSIPTAAAPHPRNDSRDIQEHASGVVSTWIHDDGGRGTSSSPTGNGSFSITTGGAPPFSTGERGASIATATASIPTVAAPHPRNDSRDIQEHGGGAVSTWIHDDGGRGSPPRARPRRGRGSPPPPRICLHRSIPCRATTNEEMPHGVMLHVEEEIMADPFLGYLLVVMLILFAYVLVENGALYQNDYY